jgi:hypothetical protein
LVGLGPRPPTLVAARSLSPRSAPARGWAFIFRAGARIFAARAGPAGVAWWSAGVAWWSAGVACRVVGVAR